jgi:HD-GYP domain-containing protein (c-di-GMP phosphodiesterase class II)
MSDAGGGTPPGRAAEPAAFTPRDVRRVRDLLARFAGARRALRFNPPGHPVVSESVAGFMEVMSELHARGLDIPLTFADNEILLGEQVLTEESMMFDQLVRDMSASDANSVVFFRGVTPQEVERVLPILGADAATLSGMGGLEAAVAAARAPHVSVSTVRALEREAEGQEISDKQAAREVYTDAVDLLREVESAIDSGRAVSPVRVRGVVRSMVGNVVTNRAAILQLAGLKDYDEYTFFHSVNVAILSLALGSMLSGDRRFLNSLGVGALLHDIGKIGIDVQVLNKPGRLNSGEWDAVRVHPLHGAEAAATMPGLDRAGMVIILEHHMRYDMDGYPERRPRRPQHLASRIVAVADAYDAMTSRRAYSAARLQDEAMSVLAKNAGTAFDPVLVRLFVQMMGVYPPRSVVRLDSGEVGVVERPGETDVLQPVVRVFAAADGGLIDPVEVDLAKPEEAAGRRIVACLDPSGMNVDVEDYL